MNGIPVKPLAALSLDLDNLWSYMKTHGDSGWETFPSYLDMVVPRVLGLLKKRNLRITFFIVGQDAALEKNSDAIRSIAEAGHEIGNHSFNHEPWLHLYPRQRIARELASAEQHIEYVTGRKPIGFRGPGYSLSRPVLEYLEQHGYRYDGSTLPTFIGPFARMYYFITARLSAEERKERKQLFGNLREGFRPLNPYHWRLDDESNSLLEIPVTTMPVIRLPFHVSYILYLSSFSPFIARLYFRLSLKLCLFTHTPPSLLLHPLDFLGSDDVKELAFFPAMSLGSERKIDVIDDLLKIYMEYFDVVPMDEFARSLSRRKDLKSIEPNF